MITRKKVIGAIRYAVLSATGVLLLWLTFRHIDLHELWLKIRQANLAFIVLSMATGFVAFLIRAYRWNMLIEPLGYRPRLSSASYALGIGYFANLAIPRIGEITRCGALSRAENIPMEKLIGTVITERIIDLVMLAFSMLLVAVTEFSLFRGFMADKIIAPMRRSAGGSSREMLLLYGLPVLALIVAGFLLYRFRHTAALTRLTAFIRGIGTGLLSVLKLRRMRAFVFHTFLMWFLYYLATWICFYALNATEHLGMKEGLFILVAGGLGMSAPVQGGIGAYHYIVSQALLLFGIGLTDGVVFATLVHTAQLILIVLVGCVSLIMLFRRRKRRAAASAEPPLPADHPSKPTMQSHA